MRQSLLGNQATGAGAPGSPAYKVLLDQLNSSSEELDVRKEEVLILRSQLVSQKEATHHKVPPRGAPSLFWLCGACSSCRFLVSPPCQFLVSVPGFSSLSVPGVSSCFLPLG